jgi:hypothetical protein
MWDEHGGDVPVVREEVALRDPLLRPEGLVQVGQLERATALPDLGLDRRRCLHHHLLGTLVLPQPLVHGRAQVTVVRPLGELDLRHELRFHPHDVALAHLRHLRHFAERRLAALQRLELGEKPVDLVLAEAGTDVARVHQLVPLPVTEDERAESPRAPPLPPGVTGDHELLVAVGLDLLPVARALAEEVAGADPLRDDAFEPLLLGRSE